MSFVWDFRFHHQLDTHSIKSMFCCFTSRYLFGRKYILLNRNRKAESDIVEWRLQELLVGKTEPRLGVLKHILRCHLSGATQYQEESFQPKSGSRLRLSVQ